MDTAVGKLFIGIDIHKRSWRIHIATDLSWSQKGLTMPPIAAKLKAYVDRLYPDYEVYTAYEAGSCGYVAHRAFESYGWHSIVFNPADLSRTGVLQYQKTDSLDATLICRELRDGRLKGITIPDPKREQYRLLFRRRNDLVKDLRRLKSRIKGQLLFLGYPIPEQYDKDTWSRAFRKWLGALEFYHKPAQISFQDLLDQYDYIEQRYRAISTELRTYAAKHYSKDYRLLQTVPGIGPIVACGILAEIGDLKRFSNQRELVAYIGLMPGMTQSGDGGVRSRGISPRGNRLLRSYFVEAAWVALRHDPVMQEYWRKHHGKDAKAKLIKVARKLLCRTYAVIKTEIPYQAGVVA